MKAWSKSQNWLSFFHLCLRLGAQLFLDYRPKSAPGEGFNLPGAGLSLPSSKSTLLNEPALISLRSRANKKMHSWPPARRGAPASSGSATSSPLCTVDHKSWSKRCAVGLALSLNSCYLGLQINLGKFGLLTSTNGCRRPRQTAVREMQTLLVEFMGRGRFLSLPPVWCSPSYLSLHRSAGAARLGCLSFPRGTGAGRAR